MTNTAKSAGLERVTAHAVRHAFATHMLEGGADFRALQQLLGHKTVQTTQIYAHVTPAELRRVHRETHPRAQRVSPPGTLERLLVEVAGESPAVCQ